MNLSFPIKVQLAQNQSTRFCTCTWVHFSTLVLVVPKGLYSQLYSGPWPFTCTGCSWILTTFDRNSTLIHIKPGSIVLLAIISLLLNSPHLPYENSTFIYPTIEAMVFLSYHLGPFSPTTATSTHRHPNKCFPFNIHIWYQFTELPHPPSPTNFSFFCFLFPVLPSLLSTPPPLSPPPSPKLQPFQNWTVQANLFSSRICPIFYLILFATPEITANKHKKIAD